MHWSSLNTFLYAVVALLVIVDPPGTAVVFAAMTPKDTQAERNSQARRACLLAFVVLAVFGLAGESLLASLGIGLPAMRVAGGILLFITAADMVRGSHALRDTDQERQAAIHTDDDIAIFPLGIPLIAGPGGMTTMVVLHSHAGGDPWKILAIEAAVAVSILLTFICLLGAKWIARALGDTGASVAGRVLGVLLAALAVQIALDGLKQAFTGG
jgi:multiple antibiotic resistance protein